MTSQCSVPSMSPDSCLWGNAQSTRLPTISAQEAVKVSLWT